MISKELLKDVMPQAKITKDGEVIIDYFFHDIIETINIYELAHECKEWAVQNGYSIFTGFIHNDDDGTWCKCDVSKYTREEELYCIHLYDYKTEPEAIFKACQWILDNKT